MDNGLHPVLRALFECEMCESKEKGLVSQRPGRRGWIELRFFCSHCGDTSKKKVSQSTHEAFTNETRRRRNQLLELDLENMEREATWFTSALREGGILPEDFGR